MFSGFSEKTSEFMWELIFNNERPWFLAHKQEFEEVLNTPFRALAEDTLSIMSEHHPDISFYSHVSRIYRDARRLFGRGPYKERLWFSIKTAPSDYDGPVFWVEIGPAEYKFGMGFWGTTELLEAYRAAIDANPAAFERIAKQLSKCPELKVEGESYKRLRGSYTGIVSEWYNLKHPGIVCTKEFGGDLFSPEFPSILTGYYEKMMPMFEFLLKIYNSAPKNGG